MPKSLAAKAQADADIEGENRIISILFADVSDSVAVTENMAPEDAAELISECLKAMVDAILKYEGSINRFLGDSVLAFFGTPEAHENDPERAVLAALEMQEAVSKLELDITIGINTGMVYVGAIGPDSHSGFTAMGTAVNLAARLEKEAEPGQILLGQATYRLTRRAFEYTHPQTMNIRGISEQVNVYRVIKPLPRPEKIRGIEGLRAEMIGREREFSDLKESVNEILSGNGQIVSIIGKAGVGKSRLVSELKEYINDKDIRWLEGRCVSIGESMGYWLFIDMLRGYLDFGEDDTPEMLLGKITDSMKALFPQRWKEAVPYVSNILSVRGGEWDNRIRNLPPEQVKQQTFFALRDVFFALSQQKPLLLIFEDLHWADSLSLDMVNLLMDTLSLAPIMLLCVHRPYKEHRSWHISAQASAKCLGRYRELTLRPLSIQESRRLVGALLDIENLPESIRESILQKAEGNPFFVEEVIRSLIESGVVYQDGERWVAKSEIESITVPDTVQSVIMSRIDRLEDEVRYVLQSASVIGRLFRHRLLGYITRQEQELDEYLWKLEERDLVYEERVIPELEYSFRHALTQETAYNNILSRRRREFHRKVAEGYEALYSSRLEEYYEELAYHYSRSDDREKALDYLVKSGDKSREGFANDAAIEYYKQALRLIDELDAESKSKSTIGHIYYGLGEIYFSIQKYEEALEHYHKALEYAIDKRQRARIYRGIGHIHEQINDLDTAPKYLNLGIAELGDDTECIEMAQICFSLFWVALKQGDYEECKTIALRGLQIVDCTEHYSEIGELYYCLSFIYLFFAPFGDLGVAYDYAQKSMEALKKTLNFKAIGRCSVNLGYIHMMKGEYDAAEELFRDAIELGSKTGNKYLLADGYWNLSQIYQKKENWDKAIEYGRSSLEVHGSPERGKHLYYLARSYAGKGDDETAIELYRESIEVAKETGRGWSTLIEMVYLSLSAAYMRRENWDAAIECLAIMEESLVLAGKWEEFASYYEEFMEEQAGALKDMKLNQWYLEPAEVSELFSQIAFMDDLNGSELRSEWEWVDTDDDSSYSLSKEKGWLTIQAAPESVLWGTNCNAPRLLQEIWGDFAVEVKMRKALDDLPLVGGLLIWMDRGNLIRFEKGYILENDMGLIACIQGKYDWFGRGRMASEITYLRLERTKDVFSAYCSSDGEKWLTCGQVTFPAEDPIKVGIYAMGRVYSMGGNYQVFDPDVDTAARFGSFRVLRKASQI